MLQTTVDRPDFESLDDDACVLKPKETRKLSLGFLIVAIVAMGIAVTLFVVAMLMALPGSFPTPGVGTQLSPVNAFTPGITLYMGSNLFAPQRRIVMVLGTQLQLIQVGTESPKILWTSSNGDPFPANATLQVSRFAVLSVTALFSGDASPTTLWSNEAEVAPLELPEAAYSVTVLDNGTLIVSSPNLAEPPVWQVPPTQKDAPIRSIRVDPLSRYALSSPDPFWSLSPRRFEAGDVLCSITGPDQLTYSLMLQHGKLVWRKPNGSFRNVLLPPLPDIFAYFELCGKTGNLTGYNQMGRRLWSTDFPPLKPFQLPVTLMCEKGTQPDMAVIHLKTLGGKPQWTAYIASPWMD